jgi:hypothetical protein
MAWSVTLVRLTSAKVIAACWIPDDAVTITVGLFTTQAGCLSREKTLQRQRHCVIPSSLADRRRPKAPALSTVSRNCQTRRCDADDDIPH